MVKEIKAIYHFCKKFGDSKWPPVLEKGEILKNCADYVKHVGQNITEIALAYTVKEIQALLSFTIFVKNWEIQNGRHFWREGKNF